MLHADSNVPERSLFPRCTCMEPMVHAVTDIEHATFAIKMHVAFGMAIDRSKNESFPNFRFDHGALFS